MLHVSHFVPGRVVDECETNMHCSVACNEDDADICCAMRQGKMSRLGGNQATVTMWSFTAIGRKFYVQEVTGAYTW
jgi:hypothetical protein